MWIVGRGTHVGLATRGTVMTPSSHIDQGALVAVSAAFGAGATALGRMLSGNRRTDKVDAVAAVAAAFDLVAQRTNAHVDDLAAQCRRMQERVDYLERELRKRDELIVQYISGRRHVSLDETGAP